MKEKKSSVTYLVLWLLLDAAGAVRECAVREDRHVRP